MLRVLAEMQHDHQPVKHMHAIACNAVAEGEIHV